MCTPESVKCIIVELYELDIHFKIYILIEDKEGQSTDFIYVCISLCVCVYWRVRMLHIKSQDGIELFLIHFITPL